MKKNFHFNLNAIKINVNEFRSKIRNHLYFNMIIRAETHIHFQTVMIRNIGANKTHQRRAQKINSLREITFEYKWFDVVNERK